MLRVVIGAATAALLLAGCGEQDEERVVVPTPEGAASVTTRGGEGDETITVEGPGGERLVAGSGAGASAAGAPGFAQPYPGARMQQSVEAPGQGGGMLVFTAPAAPETVIAYYQARAQEAGMAPGLEMTQGETRVFQAQDDASGANLGVVVTPADGTSSVQLTWSAGG